MHGSGFQGKLYSYFLSGFDYDAAGSEARNREVLTVRIVLAVSLSWIFATAVLVLARYWYLQTVTWNLLTLASFFLSFLFLLIFLKNGGTPKTSARILNVFLFAYIPLRIWQTGGIFSPWIYLYAAHCLVGYSLWGKKTGNLILFYSCASIFAFSILGEFASLPAAPFYTSPINSAVGFVLLSVIVLTPVFTLLAEKAAFTTKLRLYEQKKVSYGILNSLRKENLKSIRAGLDKLKVAEKTGDLSQTDELEKALLRMSSLVRSLSNAWEKKKGGDS